MTEHIFFQFIGPLLDALFLFGLVFPAEPFLFKAGFDIQNGLYMGAILAFLGGFTGDQISYWLGKWKGNLYLRQVSRHFPKTNKHIAKARMLFQNKQSFIIVTSRLLGPVNAFVPFLSGARRVMWLKFTLLSTLGLTIAVTQFLIGGFVVGELAERYSWVSQSLYIVKEHVPVLIVIACLLIILWKTRSLTLAMVTTGLGLTVINLGHFFWFNSPTEPVVHLTEVDYKSFPLDVYPGKSDSYAAQAINIIYIGNNPNQLMKALNWTQNKTFSRHDIKLMEYFDMLRHSTPPVSDLFWKNQPQWYAWQQPGTLTERNHIRWWYAGKTPASDHNIWVGSLSYDEHLKLTRYRGFYTVLHDTDPLIDEERDKFNRNIQSLNGWETQLTNHWKNYPLTDAREYQTDGRLLVIQASD